MKVLFLMDQMFLIGGAERILSLKLNYLANKGDVDVFLLTTEQKNKRPVYEISKKVTNNDLGINYSRSLSYFHPTNLWKIFRHYFCLRAEIIKINPDLIISVSASPDQYFLPFISKHIPKVKEFHSSGVSISKPNSLLDKFKHLLFRIFGKYDALVVLNNDELKYYPFSNLSVIPNFIHLSEIIHNVGKQKIIIAAGRIAPVKQFDHLIQAWSLIADQLPAWEVRIFGDGDPELTGILQNQIVTLKAPNIRLMGPTAQLDLEMQKASLYAMTSSTECFPMVLLEAQAAGLPIVSYDCPHGPRNIVTHEVNGLLTPSNKIYDFAQALNSLINNEHDRNGMGDSAKGNVKIYAEGRIMQQWISLFTSLIIR
jgi:glycosyltransferase involved in cell wall biosynthesis